MCVYIYMYYVHDHFYYELYVEYIHYGYNTL